MNVSNIPWEGAPGARRVFADEGPWTWYLARAWQQAAAPDLSIGGTRRPEDLTPPPNPDADELALRIAYWAPLLHLTTFGLGWRFPEIGLWQWLQDGRPTDDPVLKTIEDRYGDDVTLMMAWLVGGPGRNFRKHGFQDDDGAERIAQAVELRRQAAIIEQDARYREAFTGGGDPMHLVPHLAGTWHGEQQPVEHFLTATPSAVDHLLVSDGYGSLFAALRSETVPAMTSGRSTRVALVCPPVGWLGVYRRSRQTGLWFRGKHRWHAMGN